MPGPYLPWDPAQGNNRDRMQYGSSVGEVMAGLVKFGDRKVPISSSMEEKLKGLEKQYEVRLRPRDGRPVSTIPDSEMSRHLLLTDRETGKQFRVAKEKRAHHAVGMAYEGAQQGDVDLELYEVFEGDRFKPQFSKPVFGTDLLNSVWKECWRRPVLQPYRDLIRRAVPFTLDAAATELVTELAMKPERMRLYRQLARLPYEVVWIELDHRVQVAKQIELGSNRQPFQDGEEGEVVGYLIERLSETRWRLQYWMHITVTEKNIAQIRQSVDNPAIRVGDMSADNMLPYFVLDTEGRVDDYRTVVRDPALREAVQTLISEGNLGGIGYGLGGTEDDGRIRFSLNRDLFMTAAVDLPPDWERGTLAKIMRPHDRRDKLVQIMRVGTKELAGILRHACAALATINQAPMSIVERKGDGTFRADGRMRPFKVNRTVSITVPGRRTTVKKVLLLFQGAKRRMCRHQVRGFWRTTTRQVQPSDRWQWMWSPRYKEHRWHIWVKEFERGDAALGWVTHDYEVHT